MKYKSHHFTTLLAKAQASNAGRERRVLPHPIPLGLEVTSPPPATAPPHPPHTHTGFPLFRGRLLGESETKVQFKKKNE